MNIIKFKNRISLMIITSFLLLTSASAASLDPLEQPVKNLQNELDQTSSGLKGSTILISSKKYHFSYASQDVTPDSQFYIGSVTKHMTAFMLLKSLQKNHTHADLNQLLNMKMVTLFPDSRFLREVNKPWVNEMTLLDLLTHRSGLSDYIDYYANTLKQPTMLNTAIDPIEMVRSVTFDPSKKYFYSNTNYLILAKLVEENEQSPFNDIFKDFIQNPSGMISSDAPIMNNYHTLKDEHRFNHLMPDLNSDVFIDMSNAIGAGNAISSANDLVKWNQYFYSNKNADIRRVMLKKYFEDEDGGSENLGLSTETTRFGRLIGFQGGLDSYHSFLGYLPDHQLTIVILSNNQEDFDKLMGILINFLGIDTK